MKILHENRIHTFRDSLYAIGMPEIMRQGGDGLAPVKKYPEDERGYPLIPIKRVTRFFLEEMDKNPFVLSDQYIQELYTLFKIMVEDLPAVSFDPEASFSQEDIQDADNKTTIELLTTNVIITFFHQVKANLGNNDDSVVNPDMQSIVKKSTAGRDYKRLVSNTLKRLIFSMARDKPWFDYIKDINDADLICRLAGAKLPSMEKTTLGSITGKAQKEISGYNDLFTKLLYARAQTVAGQENKKEFFKSMAKLDAAIYGLIKKIDRFLDMAYRLCQILGLSSGSIIGDTFSKLRQNVLWLFFDVWPQKIEQGQMPEKMAVSTLRFRMNLLFNLPHITRFCREVTRDPAFHAPVNDLFHVMYRDLADKINRVSMEEGNRSRILERVGMRLSELQRAIEHLDMDESRLGAEKKDVKSAYVALTLKTGFESLEEVLNFCDRICDVTHDKDRDIMSSIRSAFMEKSFLTLEEYALKKVPPKDAIPEISRRLHAFAVHYRPQREFYRIFVDTYLISSPRPRQPHYTQFLMSNRHFAQAMLMFFADSKAMKNFLPDSYIDKAARLLADLLEKTGDSE